MGPFVAPIRHGNVGTTSDAPHCVRKNLGCRSWGRDGLTGSEVGRRECLIWVGRIRNPNLTEDPR